MRLRVWSSFLSLQTLMRDAALDAVGDSAARDEQLSADVLMQVRAIRCDRYDPPDGEPHSPVESEGTVGARH